MTTSTAMDRSAQSALPEEARVFAVEGDRARVRLGSGVAALARIAVPGYAPAEGDRVLVQATASHGGDAGLFVIGVVRARPREVVTTPSGASAIAEGDTIAIRDAGGRVIASFDGATNELVLSAEGDLKLASRAGRVRIEAAGDVEIEARGRIAERARSIAIAAETAAYVIGHVDVRAERIVERTTDALRTVEGLLETRAKHARTLVARTFELLSRRTTIASEEDTRVDGKRVLLG